MVKTVWVGIAFVCGIAVGVIGTRSIGNAPAAAGALAGDVDVPARSAVVTATDPPPLPAAKFGTAPHVTREVAVANESPAVQADNATTPNSAASPAGEGAATRKINVGAAFHDLIDRPSVPGFANEVGDTHRMLEQEARDDSWAYQMEAEIQNSLTAYVSTGELQVRFLECRTTICEMRLYHSDTHPNAFDTWQEVMPSQPWMRQVQMVGMGMTSTKGGGEALWIFRKAAQPARPERR
jgi:hypothetical protein